MPRRVQDIVPNTHRSIRNVSLERERPVHIPVQEVKRKTVSRSRAVDIPADSATTTTEEVANPITLKAPLNPEKDSSMNVRKPRRTGAGRWVLIFMGIIVVVAAVGYLASVYFSKATFTIVPRSVPFSVNGTYIAQATQNKGVLTYELATTKGDASATISATDGPQITSYAKGKITVYNGYSEQSQRLIAGTRFADDSGRIYRLTSSIVIPGYTKSSSIVPGSISASVTADQPGDSYNISKSDSISDFKIVAYKGTSKYDLMYGRIASDFSGGFSGVKKTVDQNILASTTADLKARIIASSLAQLKNTVPEGYVMYPTAYTTSFGIPSIGGTDPKSATITLKGVVYGILFKRDELVGRIAGEQAVAVFDDFGFETSGLEALDFSIANTKDFSPEKKNTLIIKLKGDGMLIGTVPVDALKEKLAGISLADTAGVLRLFKPVIDIEKSSGAITPPWSKIPSDLGRITIEVLTK